MNLKAIVAAGALALAAGSAHASVTFYSYGLGAPTLPLLTNFSGDTAGSKPVSTSAYSWSTGAVVYNKALSGGAGAEPAFGPTASDTGNYLSVLAGQTISLTLAKPVTSLELYIGSLDSYNTITFSNGATYTGANLAAYSGADNGNQMASNTNGMFDFTFGSAVDSVTFTSSANSLEIASISAGVPEPATWAMMLMGLFGLGAVIRASRRNQGVNAAAV